MAEVRISDLQEGAEVPVAARKVVSIRRIPAQAIVSFDDGTTETYDLTDDPTITVVDG